MSTITVRPLAENERTVFYHLAVITFGAAEDSDQRAARWGRFIAGHPDFDPIQVRGAFRNGQFLGGYIDYEHTLAIGPARLPAGCIGAVVTHPDYRLQGVGTALVEDAIALAQERRHALLLLDGIPNFYHRFGFANVLTEGGYTIRLADILALPLSPYGVRPATDGDAGDLLRLYHQEFDPFPGVFARTPAIQSHLLSARLPANPPLLAIDESGRACGYLIAPWVLTDPNCYEVVAPDWSTASALLQHHARLLAANDPPPQALTWQVPPGSATFFALADRIPLEGAVRHLPIGDWMARIGHLPTFLAAILPHWNQRRQNSNVLWNGSIQIDLGETTFGIDFGGVEARLSAQPSAEAPHVRLSPQALVQLTFGFRPAWWLARQPANDIPDHLLDLLQTLASTRSGWVPGTDRF